MSPSSKSLAITSALLAISFGAKATTAATTVLLSGGPNPATFGQPVTLTASVTPASASGRVTFYDGVTMLGTRPVSNGSATLTTSLLAAGRRSLRAYYAGDAANAPGSSTPALWTIQTVAGNTLYALAPIEFGGDSQPAMSMATASPKTETQEDQC